MVMMLIPFHCLVIYRRGQRYNEKPTIIKILLIAINLIASVDLNEPLCMSNRHSYRMRLPPLTSLNKVSTQCRPAECHCETNTIIQINCLMAKCHYALSTVMFSSVPLIPKFRSQRRTPSHHFQSHRSYYYYYYHCHLVVTEAENASRSATDRINQ